MRELLRDKERRQRARDAGVDPDAPIGSAQKGQNFLARPEEPNVPAPTKGTDSKPTTPSEDDKDSEFKQRMEYLRKMKEMEDMRRGGGIS
jgi:hypothetical protein